MTGSDQDVEKVGQLGVAGILNQAEEGDEVRLEFDILPPCLPSYRGSFSVLGTVEVIRREKETDRIVRKEYVLSGHSKKFRRLGVELLVDTESDMVNICREAEWGDYSKPLSSSGRIDVVDVEVDHAE